MKLRQAIEGYKVSKLGDGMSPSTIRGYDTHYSQLVDFVGDIEIEEVTQEQLMKFMIYLRQDYVPSRRNGDRSPYHSTTIRNAWCAVRSLLRWAHKELEIARPDLALKMPKVSYPEIRPFSKNEIEQILKFAVYAGEIERDGQRCFRRKNKSANRNRAIILVLLDTGIRVSECVNLRVQDVNYQSGEIFVRPVHAASKNKSRTLRIGAATTKAVWRYLAEREKTYPEDPLFLSEDNQRITRSCISQLTRRIGNNAGIQSCHPHRFRHTFAIQFLRNGGDVFSLQHALGHSDWTMTRHYANLAQSDFANTHRRASPVDNWRL